MRAIWGTLLLVLAIALGVISLVWWIDADSSDDLNQTLNRQSLAIVGIIIAFLLAMIGILMSNWFERTVKRPLPQCRTYNYMDFRTRVSGLAVFALILGIMGIAFGVFFYIWAGRHNEAERESYNILATFLLIAGIITALIGIFKLLHLNNNIPWSPFDPNAELTNTRSTYEAGPVRIFMDEEHP